jgi:hypothetical protein
LVTRVRTAPVPAISPVRVTPKSTSADKLTGQPVRATVQQDGVVIFR